MMFIVIDSNNEIIEHTLGDSEYESWNKYLGFTPTDDQWAWKVQQAKEKGFKCVPATIEAFISEVEMTEEERKTIDSILGTRGESSETVLKLMGVNTREELEDFIEAANEEA